MQDITLETAQLWSNMEGIKDGDKDSISADWKSVRQLVREGSASLATESVIYRYSRQAGSTQLAALLDEVAQRQASIDTD